MVLTCVFFLLFRMVHGFDSMEKHIYKYKSLNKCLLQKLTSVWQEIWK